MTLDKPCKDSWRAKNKDGYHVLAYKIWGFYLEHRYLYSKEYGNLSPEEEVRHLCNNSWCIEITHLSKGTHKENMQDSLKEGPFNSYLNSDIVNEIRDLAEYDKWSATKISEYLHIPRRTVSHIINYDTWKHV